MMSTDLNTVRGVFENLKGLRPLPSTPEFRIFRFLRKMSIFVIFRWDLGWGGLQWIGNGCGIQIDGFSVQTETYGFILYDFHDVVDFGIVFGGLMLLPEGPRTLRECSEGPGTL